MAYFTYDSISVTGARKKVKNVPGEVNVSGGGKDNDIIVDISKIEDIFYEFLSIVTEYKNRLVQEMTTKSNLTEESLYPRLEDFLLKVIGLFPDKKCMGEELIKVTSAPSLKDIQKGLKPDFSVECGQNLIGVVEAKFRRHLGIVTKIKSKKEIKEEKLDEKLQENFDQLIRDNENQIKGYLMEFNNVLFTNFYSFFLIQGGEENWNETYIRKNTVHLNLAIDVTREGVLNKLDEELLKLIIETKEEKDLDSKIFDNELLNIIRLWVLLYKFFSYTPTKITSPKRLAKRLAIEAKDLRKYISGIISKVNSENQSGKIQAENIDEIDKIRIRKVEDSIKSRFGNRNYESFEDLLTQVIIYTFVATRVEKSMQKRRDPDKNLNTEITLEDVKEQIKSKYILSIIFEHLLDYFEDTKLKSKLKSKLFVILDIVNSIDMEAITYEYKKYASDFFTHFYETFLAEYNPEIRRARGVYYTPIPVVNFIVEGVNYLLKDKDKFNLDLGLADASVKVTDPAIGTGSFLARAIEVAGLEYQSGLKSGNAPEFNSYTKHMFYDFVGFEIMLAPYVISHLRVKKALNDFSVNVDKEIKKQEKERKGLSIYLHNTLGNPNDISTEEDVLALEERKRNCGIDMTKEKNKKYKLAESYTIDKSVIEVVIGNPPYNVSSSNKSKWIEAILEAGENEFGFRSYYDDSLNPREKGHLQNDYVKFIRFAQCKVHNSGKGIVGMITANSFLCHKSFYAMRRSLLETFDEIYIIDLLGDSRIRGTKCKEEDNHIYMRDENIFDISVGVTIFFFVKTGKVNNNGGAHTDKQAQINDEFTQTTQKNAETTQQQNTKYAKVYYTSICGSREKKLSELETKSLQYMIEHKKFKEVDIEATTPGKNLYCFRPTEKIEDENKKRYIEKWIGLDRIFNQVASGIITGNDKDLINFTEDELEKKLHKIEKNKYKMITYRPFDDRYIYYDENLVHAPMKGIMKHMLRNYQENQEAQDNQVTQWNQEVQENQEAQKKKEEWSNIALLFVKNTRRLSGDYNSFVTDKLADYNFFATEIAYVAPLYLYDGEGGNETKRYNFKQDFVDTLAKKYEKDASSFIENIFYYIYAILFCPSYTSTYRDELKLGIAHIPFVSDYSTFLEIADKGKELVETHLLRNADQLLNVKYKGSSVFYYVSYNEPIYIKKIKYDEKTNRIIIYSDEQDQALKGQTNEKAFYNIEKKMWEFKIGSVQILKAYLSSRKKLRFPKGKLTEEEADRFIKIAMAIKHTLVLQEDIDNIYKTKKVDQNSIDFSTNNVINYSKKNESQYSLLFKLAEIARNKNNASVYSRQTESQRNLLSRLAEIARQEKYYSNKSSLLRSLLRVTKRSFRDY